jgi:hypothetical protein
VTAASSSSSPRPRYSTAGTSRCSRSTDDRVRNVGASTGSTEDGAARETFPGCWATVGRDFKRIFDLVWEGMPGLHRAAVRADPPDALPPGQAAPRQP